MKFYCQVTFIHLSGAKERKESIPRLAKFLFLIVMKSERVKQDGTEVYEQSNWTPPPQIRYLSVFLTFPME
ncbi:hypothetical protein RB195_004713 [Necator americanus]|uniref:Uncharacterized protein n=1 Tax=Necator americanus TaxID=51031 RepID=A0ABR1BJB1_NECAM